MNELASKTTTQRAVHAAPVAVRRRAAGLTLIELLVVVVIMTTLVAGIVPLMSPNNDTRKIREGARDLHTYIVRAQAEAARTGRNYGIGFKRYNQAGDGASVEAFSIAEPAAFAGFSDYSQVQVYGQPQENPPGTANPNFNSYYKGAFALYTGPTFSTNLPFYAGMLWPDEQFPGLRGIVNRDETYTAVYRLDFYDRLATALPIPPFPDPADTINAANFPTDGIPPHMLRYGDRVLIGEQEFLIVDGSIPNGYVYPNTTNPPIPNTNTPESPGSEFLAAFNGPNPVVSLYAAWLSGRNKYNELTLPQGLQSYRILRRPTNTQDTPVAFPRAIALDWFASGYVDTSGTFHSFSAGRAGTVAILFGPTGQVASVQLDGVPQANVATVYLLMGKVENALPLGAELTTITNWGGNSDADVVAAYDDVNFSGSETDDELTERRGRLNWLNGDSKWIVISARSGRATVSDVAAVDPRPIATNTNFGDVSSRVIEQLRQARRLAADFKRTGE